MYIAQHRAWIQLESIRILSPLEWDATKKEATLTVRCIFKNTGQTLAKSAWFEMQMKIGVGQAKAEYDELSKRANKLAKHLGHTLVPGGTARLDHTIRLAKDDIEKYAALVKKDPWATKIAVPIRLLGCLDYGLTVEEERRQSGFIFDLRRKNDPQGHAAMGPLWGDTPIDQLEIDRSIFGDIIMD